MSTSVLESKGYIASSEAPFIQEMSEITRHMWELGWDELNGGNVSYLLDENEVAKYINVLEPLRTIKLTFL